MAVSPQMIVAGFGFRAHPARADFDGALKAALAHHNISADETIRLAGLKDKSGGARLQTFAAELNLPQDLFDLATLRLYAAQAISHSQAAMAAYGIPSLAETAALAGAAPHGRLLGPRVIYGDVVCALARTDGISG